MKTTRIMLGLLLTLATAMTARAQISAFTYQGRLNLNGAPANGSYDLMFRLLNDATNGVAAPVIPVALAVPVSNGLFTTGMDFGAENFDGANRWLEISVRTNGGGSFTTLAPRQALTPTPYAIQAVNAAVAASVSGSVSAGQLTGTISPNNISAGSITTAMLAAGAVGADQLAAGAVTTGALADGAVTAAKVATVSNWFALTIANPTPTAWDNFGISVAAMGSDRILVGAWQDDMGAEDAGAAYLFSTNGALLTAFTNPAPTAGDLFGLRVAAVGADRVLIGAIGDDTGATGAGATYLFSTNGTLLSTFVSPTPAYNERFGYSVAAVGTDRVLIGAYGNNAGAMYAGAAYLFSTSGALLTTFTNPTPADWDNFGISVAEVGSDRVLIGAFHDNTGAVGAGAAYLFSTNGALLTTFTNPTPADWDFFGDSVAAVGTDRVLIGAIGDDTGATDAGAAYLFSTNGALLSTFTNPTPAASDVFGISVAGVGADQVLIGAWHDNTTAEDAGAAYLFSTNGVLLTTFTNPMSAAGDGFGYSVAAAGTDRVLIGAIGDDTDATDAGSVYLLSLAIYSPGLVAESVKAGSITTASLEDGAVTATKIGGVLMASRIPDLDTSKITSGILADGRLSSNVARLNANQVFAGSNRFAGVVELANANNSLVGTFSGNGQGLTYLDAAHIHGTISPNNIAAGTISGAMLAAGAVGASQLATGVVTTSALADGAVTATKMAAVSIWNALAIASPSHGIEDYFCWSVAAVGTDRVLIGVPGKSTGATYAGIAYLFSTSGALLTTFTNPTPAAGDRFGRSVAALGTDRILIGANQDDTGAGDSGAAYLFSTNGILLTTFINPTPAASDQFGSSVAAVGSDRVLIGAWGDDAGATDAGAAFLFNTNGMLLATFNNPTPGSDDWFGVSVAAVGSDRVLIGANGDDTGAVNAGVAYLFSTGGVLLTTFTNPTPANGDNFGYSVAAVGSDRVLIGAYCDDTGTTDAGAAYLFSTSGALLITLTKPVPAVEDKFGCSVAAVGADRLLIGAYLDNTGAENAGAAYLFSTNGALLKTFTNPAPTADDYFGYSMAAVGTDRVLIGTPYHNAAASDAGAAYLFSLETYTPGLVTEGVKDGAVTAAKLDPAIGVWTRAGDDVFRLGGRVGIGTSSFTSNRLQVAGMVGAMAFNTTSDRAAKQNFTAVDAQAVLDKLTALPITQWRFKEFPGALHLGPTAQDFRAAFGLGLDDLSIATVDADGVALAAIQGLNEKVEVRDQRSEARIQKLEAENVELRKRLTELEGFVRALSKPEAQR